MRSPLSSPELSLCLSLCLFHTVAGEFLRVNEAYQGSQLLGQSDNQVIQVKSRGASGLLQPWSGHFSYHLYHRHQNYYTNLFLKELWHNQLCRNYKKITLQSNFLGMFSCQKGHSSGSNITKELLWRISFAKITNMMAKDNVRCTKIMHRHSPAIFAGNPAVPKDTKILRVVK